MKKVFIVLTVLLLTLICGCADGQNQSTIAPEAVVKQPTDSTVNGYRISEPAESATQSTVQSGELSYYANKNTKTFHLSTCGTAKRIKNENLYITTDRNELLLEDYKPCSNCNP